MSQSSDTSSDAKPKSGARRLLRLVLILGVLFVALVAALPAILSSDFIRERGLNGANEAVAGSIELDDLSLSWSDGQSLAGLRAWSGGVGEGKPLFALPAASFDMKYMPILAGTFDVSAEVSGFDAQLVLHPDGSTNIDEFLGVSRSDDSGGDGDGGGEPGSDKPAELPEIPLVADIQLRDGRATLIDEALGVTGGIEGLNVSITSPSASAPIDIDVTANVRIQDTLAPFKLQASALGSDKGAKVVMSSQGLRPGAMSGPILAAAFPLLAGDGSGAPPKIDAPLGFDIDVAAPDLAALMAGDVAGLTGSVTLEMGEGQISGTVMSIVRKALEDLNLGGLGLGDGGLTVGGFDVGALAQKAGAGSQLSDKLKETTGALDGLKQLTFRGFKSSLQLDGALAKINGATLTTSDGQTRPLPIDGHFDLQARTLHYTLPWTALLPTDRAEIAGLLGDRAISITGPLAAPVVDLNLDDVLSQGVQNALQAEIDKLKGQAQAELDKQIDKVEKQANEEVNKALDKLDPEKKKQLDGILGEGTADKLGEGTKDAVDDVIGGLGGLFGGKKKDKKKKKDGDD